MVVQSMMFSSTMQILGDYLDSPPDHESSPEMLRGKSHLEPQMTRAPMSAANLRKSQLNTVPESPTSATSSYPSSPSSSSPGHSPASSNTSAFSDAFSPQIAPVKEIRRRRNPKGVEIRPKNLELLRSNGATHLPLPPPLKEAAQVSATSNYDHSPPIESPPDLPPPPPPKMFNKFVQQNQVTRKSFQSNPGSRSESKTDSDPTFGNKDQARLSRSTVFGIASVAAAPEDTPTLKLVKNRDDQLRIPPRSDSLLKGATNFPNPKQASALGHKRNLSTSSNKDLPPAPEPDLPPLPRNLLGAELPPVPPGVHELPTLPSEKMPAVAHSRGKSSTALDILNTLRAVSPLTAKTEDDYERGGKHLSLAITPLGLKSASPKAAPDGGFKAFSKSDVANMFAPQRQDANSWSSVPSLTSASLTAPFSQPSFRTREPDDLRKRLRSRTPPQREQSKIPPASQGLAVEFERSMTPSQQLESIPISKTPETLKSDSPQPSVSSLPGVPELRSPLHAPELKPAHFSCYTQHRPLLMSSNINAPVLCMVCREDSEQMWKCGWCCLRICGGCKMALGDVRGNLKRVLDESKNGKLKIGKERMPLVSPIERTDTAASFRSASSSSQSDTPYARVGPAQDQSQFPGSLIAARGIDRGFTPVGPSTTQQMKTNEPRSLAVSRAPPSRADTLGQTVISSQRNQPVFDRNQRFESIPSRSRFRPAFGDVPIGTSIPMATERGRSVRGPSTRTISPDFDDGETTPPMDLHLDAGVGAMGAGMRSLNPNLSSAGPKLPSMNQPMGLPAGPRPKASARDRLLIA